MSISFEKVSAALEYMAKTDEGYGMLKGKMKGLEYKIKITLAVETMKGEESSNAANECKARTSKEYMDIVQEYEDTVIDFEVIAAKRKRAELMIEVWRSVSANQRVGNV